MGDAIKRCQFLGVPVSLSIGGFGAAYSLPTNLSALALFDHLWNTYFGGNLTDPRRPFGDAWLDGVDMFLEHATPAEHYNTLALELAKHNIRAGDGKLLHLTATPHCGFPDARQGGPRHGHLRARPRQVLRRRRLRRRVQRRGVGKVDGSVPLHQVLRRRTGVPGGGRERWWVHGPRDARQGRAPCSAEGEQLRRRHGLIVWDRYFDKRSNYSASIKTWV
ncbi:hypothetical protein BS78_05G208700 [Paspalum vaginatum]|nr:hypothetical protein BS78_05G208700 [Paspalum vaginatum]